MTSPHYGTSRLCTAARSPATGTTPRWAVPLVAAATLGNGSLHMARKLWPCSHHASASCTKIVGCPPHRGDVHVNAGLIPTIMPAGKLCALIVQAPVSIRSQAASAHGHACNMHACCCPLTAKPYVRALQTCMHPSVLLTNTIQMPAGGWQHTAAVAAAIAPLMQSI
jgi:hypothetical protein